MQEKLENLVNIGFIKYDTPAKINRTTSLDCSHQVKQYIFYSYKDYE